MSEPAVDRARLTAAYLTDLGLTAHSGSRGLLELMIRRHVATYAFSSVGPRLGDELSLDPVALFDRIVTRRRGGYCFEHNGLAYEVLEDLGYRPRLVLGRVLLSGDPHPGLTHRISIVALDGVDHVVDVGFGASGPHLPVPFGGEEVGSDWRRYRVVKPTPGHWHLQSWTDGTWLSLYRFELNEYGRSDCEVGHFYSHRHPKAVFVTTLVASSIHDREVRSLRNRDYWVVRPDGTETRTLGSATELRELLAEQLGIQVTGPEAVRLWGAAPGLL